MDLDKLEIALRPRTHWEAIDLGFALARRWFIPLTLLWLMTALPVALIVISLSKEHLVVMSLLIWWCKPLYEPPLMFWLSRAVFGERLSLKSVRKKWWRIVSPQLFANLTWRRLSSNRSFYMPVALLEGLRGKERQQRITILGRKQHAGTWLTVVGIHFEVILEYGALLLILFLIPEELRWFHGDNFFLHPGPIDTGIQTVCWLASMAIIAPFYVAGGFALYLHRRSELEGWDIEINFRRTAERVAAGKNRRAAGLITLLFVLCLGMGTPPRSYAATEPSPKESKQTIEKVLADPLFGHMEQKHYWQYVGNSEKKKHELPEGLMGLLKLIGKIIAGFMHGFANVWEVLMWGGGLFIVAYLIYQLLRNRNWMLQLPGFSFEKKRQRPSELFGLDVRPESLPEDVVAAALQRLHQGELRVALSLLYRGALVKLVTEHQLEILDSATEGECLQLVQRHRARDEAAYFQQLTRSWQVTAYAHTPADAKTIEQLCHDWQKVYGHVGQ